MQIELNNHFIKQMNNRYYIVFNSKKYFGNYITTEYDFPCLFYYFYYKNIKISLYGNFSINEIFIVLKPWKMIEIEKEKYPDFYDYIQEYDNRIKQLFYF